MLKRFIKSKVLLSIFLILLGVRIVLPYIAEIYLNKKLADVDGYKGHIGDIDLALWRGKYSLGEVSFTRIPKKGEKPPPSVFYVKQMEFNLEWLGLLRGYIEGDITIKEPKLLYIEHVTVKEDKKVPDVAEKVDWQQALRGLFPIKISEFRVVNGEIEFEKQKTGPDIQLFVRNLDIEVKNLTNRVKSKEDRFAESKITGKVTGKGDLAITARVNPLSEPPAFDINAQLKNIHLVHFNPLFKEVAGFDLESGRLDVFAEVASVKNQVTGYIKPLFHDLDVLGKHDKKDGIFTQLWEGIIGTAAEVLENQPKDRFAARIPITGQIDNPKAQLWDTFISILRNAFVRVLIPRIENSVDLNDANAKAAKKPKKDKPKKTKEAHPL